MAKKNDGAPGIDRVTFEVIEEGGEESFLQQIRDELVSNTYRPMRARKKEVPKDGGKVRVLSIPSIRDRVVQGALKLILEPIFEADFQPGSYVWLARAVEKRQREELVKLKVEINEEKSKLVDLANGGSFTFLGFEYRRILGRNQKWRAYYAPKLKKRDGAGGKAEGDLPTKCQPAGGGGDRADQPGPSWLGELLCLRRFE
jgi:hypothetical protein